MNRTWRTSWFGVVLIFGAGGTSSASAAEEGTVAVVVDMTEAGRKVAPPSAGHPAFYVPMTIGYREEGAKIPGDPAPPPPAKVQHELAKALAQQGYYVVGPKTAAPSLLLVFAWGSWNPIVDYVPDDLSDPGAPGNPDGAETPADTSGGFVSQRGLRLPQGQGEVRNGGEMLALVAGNTLKHMPSLPSYMTNWELEEAKSDATDDRYFVVVAAFDWNSAKQHNRQLLWSAKMSIRSTGTVFNEAFPQLIASGGPFFGRETLKRQEVPVSLGKEGKVEFGELKVMGFVDDGKGGKPPARPAETLKAPAKEK